MDYQSHIKTNLICCAWFIKLVLLLAITACSGGPGDNNTTVETGSVTFRVLWEGREHNNGYSRSRSKSPSGDVCIDYDIDTIACNIYDDTGTIVKSQNWPCSNRSGQISDVPSGSGMRITLEGIAAGAVNWRGQSSAFTVSKGETTAVGFLTLAYIGNDQLPPSVHAESPVDGLSNVSLNTNLSVQFTEDVVSVSVISAFTMMADATVVNGNVHYDADSRTATFTPTKELMESTLYTASISSIVEDIAGNQMDSDYVWSFTTTTVDAPSITTQAATEVNPTTARLNALVNPNGFAASYYFEYGPDQNYGFTTTTQDLASGRDPVHVSADISGLDPGGAYHFRAIATNSGGSSNGANLSFSTVAVWAKTFHTNGVLENHRNLIQQTADGGYIVASTTEVADKMKMTQIVLTKLDSNGSIIWQNAYDGVTETDDKPFSLLQVADGGFALVAIYDHTLDSNKYGTVFIKLGANGELDKSQLIGGSPSHLIQTTEGGYAIAADVRPNEGSKTDFWVIKLSSNADFEWDKSYGGYEYESVAQIQQTTDGGFIVTGDTTSFGEGEWDGWVLKLAPDGAVLWQKTYGGKDDEHLRSVQQTADDGYVLVGDTRSYGAGGADIWILKLAADGTLVWQKTYGGKRDDVGTDVRQTTDGGYIVTGDTSSFSINAGNERNIIVLKINTDGAVDWQKLYGGDQDERGGSVLQTNDGGFILSGSTKSYGPLNTQSGALWVLKIDQNGVLGCGIDSDTSVAIFTPTAITRDTMVTEAEKHTGYDYYIPLYKEDSTLTIDAQCP